MPIGRINLISGNGHIRLYDFETVIISLFISLKYLKKNNGNKIKNIFININCFFCDSILAPSIKRVKIYVEIVTPAKRIEKTGLILI